MHKLTTPEVNNIQTFSDARAIGNPNWSITNDIREFQFRLQEGFIIQHIFFTSGIEFLRTTNKNGVTRVLDVDGNPTNETF